MREYIITYMSYPQLKIVMFRRSMCLWLMMTIKCIHMFTTETQWKVGAYCMMVAYISILIFQDPHVYLLETLSYPMARSH